MTWAGRGPVAPVPWCDRGTRLVAEPGDVRRAFVQEKMPGALDPAELDVRVLGNGKSGHRVRAPSGRPVDLHDGDGQVAEHLEAI